MRGRVLRPKDAYLFSFLAPALIMVAIFFSRGIFPFGEQSFLRTDMYHQYAPFFSEFQYKLKNGGSLLFSWDVGLGVNFAALYAYYLASPLNFLIIFVPKPYVLEFMTYLVVFKIAMAGVTATAYFRKHYQKMNFACCLFGIFYAMSGYVAAYSWNIMWLDCIVLFPLVMLGVERLFREGNGTLYVISLSLSILSNYYISIMVCLFLVVYFLCLFILEGAADIEDAASKFLRFAFYSLISGGMAAIILIPEIFALQATASGKLTFPDTSREYFMIIDMLARHLPCVETEQGLDHWPNIYCGSMAFLLVPLFFMNRKIKLRRKLVFGCLALFFYLSFSVNVLNFIWHGFHYPNSLPCRQSFIYIFLVLCMCYEAFLWRRQLDVRDFSKALWIGGAVILVLQKTALDEAMHWSVFYVGFLFMLIYYGFLMWERRSRAWVNLMLLLLMLTVVVESAVNMGVTSVTTTSRTQYQLDNEDVRKLVRDVREEDPGFYRFEKMTRKAKDDGAWMNFPSVSIFSSTAYKHCSDFFKKLGCEAATNAYSITGSTPLVTMLFGVRYGIYSDEPSHVRERGLRFIDGSGSTFLYRNDYSLPAGFLMGRRELDGWHLEQGNPAMSQISLCDAMGTDSVLHAVPGSINADNTEYSFTADEAGEYYVFTTNRKLKEASAHTNTLSKNFDNLDRGFFMELGYMEAGEVGRIKANTSGQSMDCDVYRFDFQALGRLYSILEKNTWNVSTWKDTYVSGNAMADKDGLLITSIPYDPGWTVFVDGEKVEAEKALDCFIGVWLDAGEHEVEMRFFPKGMIMGAWISAASLALFLLSVFLSGRLSLLPSSKKSGHGDGNPGGVDGLYGRGASSDHKESGRESSAPESGAGKSGELPLYWIGNRERDEDEADSGSRNAAPAGWDDYILTNNYDAARPSERRRMVSRGRGARAEFAATKPGGVPEQEDMTERRDVPGQGDMTESRDMPEHGGMPEQGDMFEHRDMTGSRDMPEYEDMLEQEGISEQGDMPDRGNEANKLFESGDGLGMLSENIPDQNPKERTGNDSENQLINGPEYVIDNGAGMDGTDASGEVLPGDPEGLMKDGSGPAVSPDFEMSMSDKAGGVASGDANPRVVRVDLKQDAASGDLSVHDGEGAEGI